MSDKMVATVYAALGRQLKINADQVRAQATASLDGLGLDSHGLMRVLLDIERELQLSSSLELPDEALESPSTLAAGVVQVVGG
jgi:acyl carrier protein